MKKSAKQRPLLAAALAAAVVWGGISLWPEPVPAVAAAAAVPSPVKPPAARTGRERISDDWQAVLAACEKGEDPEEIRRQLADLKKRWLEEDDLYLVAATSAHLLRGGADAKTGMAFEVGKGRSLKGWPTLRVFLLEMLGTTDPDLAAEVAREVLGTTGSAEEYAVALKALLGKGPWRAPDAELEGYFSTMLAKPDWQRSAGLAEALDLARVVATPAATATLAGWLDGSPPAREVGEMALHETAAADARLVTELIAQQPGLFEDQGGLRAGLMARAVVSDAGQPELVDGYLRNPAVPVEEKREFLAVYPLRSATTGYRLYGDPPAPYERTAVVADDQAALEAVGRWKADPALAELLPEMGKLEGRLQTWVKQGGE